MRCSEHRGADLPSAMKTAKLKICGAIVWIFIAAVPVAAQSLKIPFAALSPTYTPLWIADQAGLLGIWIGCAADLYFSGLGDYSGDSVGPGRYRQHELGAGANRLGSRR